MKKIALALCLTHSFAFGSTMRPGTPVTVHTSGAGSTWVSTSSLETMGDLRKCVEEKLGVSGGFLVSADQVMQDTDPLDIRGSGSPLVYALRETRKIYLPVIDTLHDNVVAQVPYTYGENLGRGFEFFDPTGESRAIIQVHSEDAESDKIIIPGRMKTLTPCLEEKIRNGKCVLYYAYPED